MIDLEASPLLCGLSAAETQQVLEGSPRVALSVSRQIVTPEIQDSGPGLASEVAQCLFEPFVTHEKPHASGLGLSICKRIVEDHGGRIAAHSEPGRGAVFAVTLPIAT